MRVTRDDCGETYSDKDSPHYLVCDGPAMRRYDVAEMIREALAERRPMQSRILTRRRARIVVVRRG